MKVKELIEILEKMDKEKKVMLFDENYGEFYETCKENIQEHKNENWVIII